MSTDDPNPSDQINDLIIKICLIYTHANRFFLELASFASGSWLSVESDGVVNFGWSCDECNFTGDSGEFVSESESREFVSDMDIDEADGDDSLFCD